MSSADEYAAAGDSNDDTTVESHNNHHVRVTEPPESERYHHDGIGETVETVDSNSGLQCSNCHQPNALYESYPCRCLKFCKKCAMKMATGGKCRTCHQLFSTMVLGGQGVESHSIHNHVHIVEPPEAERYHHDLEVAAASAPGTEETPAHIFNGIPDLKCANCDHVGVEYTGSPCRCLNYCKKCAMRMPTGAKCHACHGMIFMHHVSEIGSESEAK